MSAGMRVHGCSKLFSLAHRPAAYAGFLVLLVALHRAGVLVFYSGDEDLYVEAGRRYLEGTAPVFFNFEHPPLAKYLIGLCTEAGLGRLCPEAWGWLGLVGFGEAAWLLGLRSRAWLGALAALLLDPVFLSISYLYMLDVYMLGFFGLGLAAALRLLRGGGLGWAAVAGALLGAAFASKMMCLVPCLAVLLLVAWRRGALAAAVLAATALGVYLSSYVGDVAADGLGLVVEHHLKMLRYMSWRHGFEPVLAADGWLLYFARLELWSDIGTVRIIVPGNTTGIVYLTSVEYMLHPPRLSYKFVPYAGSLLLPLSPVAAAAVGGPVALLHLASLWALIYGPIWWYLLLPVYTGHLVLGLWLSKKRLGWLVHVTGSAAALLLALLGA